MSTVVVRPEHRRLLRPPVGLLLSIGAPKPESGPGRPIDHIRPKEGALSQFAEEAAKFTEVYGPEPKSLDDVYYLVDDVAAVLQVRLTAFSQTGIRAIGATNYAALPSDEFIARAWSYDDDVLFFPKDVSEVRPELRESWEGEPIPGHLDGWEDPRREKIGFKLTASLEFCLPRVMGVGKVARISTSSRNSIRNLYAALWDEWAFFGGRLVGVPFRLALRPKPTQRFDAKAKKYTSTTVYELVVDTPHTVEEIYEAIKTHRRELGMSNGGRELESRMLMRALDQTTPELELPAVREEPSAAPSEALLNRLARLQAEVEEIGGDWRTLLRGVFGAEDARELDPEDASRYEAMLDQALPAEPVEGEVVSESGPGLDATSTQGEAFPEGNDGVSGPDQSAGEPGEDGSSSKDVLSDPAQDALGGAVGSSPAEPSGSPVRSDPEPRPVAPEEAAAAASSPPPEEGATGLGATVIPLGSRQGQTLHRVRHEKPDWLGWALNNRGRFEAHPEFLLNLAAYVDEVSEP